jgi:hypothetical protein
MQDNTLVESSFSAIINAPIEQVDIPAWCFTLPESEYHHGWTPALIFGSLSSRAPTPSSTSPTST